MLFLCDKIKLLPSNYFEIHNTLLSAVITLLCSRTLEAVHFICLLSICMSLSISIKHMCSSFLTFLPVFANCCPFRLLRKCIRRFVTYISSHIWWNLHVKPYGSMDSSTEFLIILFSVFVTVPFTHSISSWLNIDNCFTKIYLFLWGFQS